MEEITGPETTMTMMMRMRGAPAMSASRKGMRRPASRRRKLGPALAGIATAERWLAPGLVGRQGKGSVRLRRTLETSACS